MLGYPKIDPAGDTGDHFRATHAMISLLPALTDVMSLYFSCYKHSKNRMPTKIVLLPTHTSVWYMLKISLCFANSPAASVISILLVFQIIF